MLEVNISSIYTTSASTLAASQAPIPSGADAISQVAPDAIKASTDAGEEAASSLCERICTWFGETADSISTTVSGYYSSVTSQIDQTAASVKNSEIVQKAFQNEYLAPIAPMLPYVGGIASGVLMANGTLYLMDAYIASSLSEEALIIYLQTVNREPVLPRPRISTLKGAAALAAGSLTLLATQALSKEADQPIIKVGATMGMALGTSLCLYCQTRE